MEKAFAQFSRLPKMLNRKAIVETLLSGCRNGLFVLRSTRSDNSHKIFWYDAPDPASVKDLNLHIVLSEEAMLTTIPTRLLSPNVLPELWQGPELTLRDLYGYFCGRTVSIKHGGYEESLVIPRAERSVVNEAVQAAVKEKRLWLLAGRASLLAEDVPSDVLVEDAILQVPPSPLAGKDVLPENLPEAWKGGTETTAREIADALSTTAGKALPWVIVRDALTAAFIARFVDRLSGQWPCDYAGAHMVRVSQRTERKEKEQETPQHRPTSEEPKRGIHQPAPPYAPGMLVAQATLSMAELQDLEEQLGPLGKACREYFDADPSFSVRIEVRPKAEADAASVERVNQILGEVSRELRFG